MFFFKRNKKKDEAEKPVSADVTPAAENVPQSTPEPEAKQSSEPAAKPFFSSEAKPLSTLEVEQSPTRESEQPPAPEAKQLPAAEAKQTSAPEIRQPLQPEPFKAPVAPSVEAKPAAVAEAKKPGFFSRITQGLRRTSTQFSEGLGNLLLGKKAIDDELLEELETQLLIADVGVEATSRLIDTLTAKVARKQLADSGALYEALQTELRSLLQPAEQPLQIDASKKPFVILVVGVNGVGSWEDCGLRRGRLRPAVPTLGSCGGFRSLPQIFWRDSAAWRVIFKCNKFIISRLG